jgi:acyl-CoA synthetase (AMP-forming)/AMP-acid ligase II
VTDGGGGRTERDALRAAWRRAGVYPHQTVGDAIADGCASHAADRIVFAQVDGVTTEVTLGSLLERAWGCAARLAGAGVQAGHAVVLQAPADLSGTEALVAVWLLHAVAVPVATTAAADEVAHAARQTGASSALVAPGWRGRDLVTPLLNGAGLPELRRVIALGDVAVGGAEALGSLRPAPIPPSLRPHPSAVACVLYTSGSTAAPKGVQHSHETLLCGVTAVPADGASRMLGTFPAGHVRLAARSSPPARRRWDDGGDGPLERPRRGRAH